MNDSAAPKTAPLAHHLQDVFHDVYNRVRADEAWWRPLFHTALARHAYEFAQGRNVVSTTPPIAAHVDDYKLLLTWSESDEHDPAGRESLAARTMEGAARFARWDEVALKELLRGQATCLHPSTSFTTAQGLPLFTTENTVEGHRDAVGGDWEKARKRLKEVGVSRFLVVCHPSMEDALAGLLEHTPRATVIGWPLLLEDGTPRDWYVFGLDDDRRPFVVVDRNAVRSQMWELGTTQWDPARRLRGVEFDIRVGYAIADPRMVVKVSV